MLTNPPLPIATALPFTAVDVTSDEALALRADVDSFMALYQRYMSRVYRYTYARLGNKPDAEDVTALVFERAWTNLGRFRPSGPFRGWLFTIAARTLAEHYRRRKPTVSVDETQAELHDTAWGPEDRAFADERRVLVVKLVRNLKAEQQNLLLLRFVAELPYSEIAQITGTREGALKVRVHRLLERLRKDYSDAYKLSE